MFDPLSPAADADLEALSSVARTLEPVMPHERRSVLRDEAALLLDGLLVRVARGRGAIDLALGDGLASLTVGDRLLRLGFSSLGDYARERLGIAGSTAEKARPAGPEPGRAAAPAPGRPRRRGEPAQGRDHRPGRARRGGGGLGGEGQGRDRPGARRPG